MRQSTSNLALLVIPLVVAGAFLAHEAALAQPVKMEIEPARFEFTAWPGQVLPASVAFSNGSGAAMPIHAEGADFRPADEDGKIAVGQAPDGGRSLKDWIAPGVRDLVAPAGAKTAIGFAVHVPADARPGAYWGVLVLKDPGQFHLAPIILVNVLGEAPERLAVASFAGAVSATGSVTFVARLRNDGALYEKPTGTVVVRNIFGTMVAEAALPAENVLPGYVRRVAVSVGSGLWPGPYIASVQATYGSAGHRVSSMAVVWVLPRWVLAGFALGSVGILTVLAVFLRGRLRAKKLQVPT